MLALLVTDGFVLVGDVHFAHDLLTAAAAGINGVKPLTEPAGMQEVDARMVFCWLLARELAVWTVLVHELTHAMVGLLFLRRVRGLAATDAGGVVALDQGGDNFLITLAPYCLPTLALLWLPALTLLREQHQDLAAFMLGILLGYHAKTSARDFHFGQPDIIRSGQIFSVLFCVTASIALFGFVSAVVEAEAFSGGFQFLANGVYEIAGWVHDFWRAVSDLLTRERGGADGEELSGPTWAGVWVVVGATVF